MSEKKFKCNICQEEEKESNLPPCKCHSCLDCLFSWIKQKNEESLYLKEEFYPCTTSKCPGEKLTKDWLFTKISKDKQEILETIILKKYFNSSSDIIKCPKEKCNFVGFTDNLPQSRICQEPFKCELCQNEWTLNKDEDNNENFISEFFRKLKENFSETRINIISVPCMHCGRFVNKFTGCNHITCVCKNEFCYVCFENWPDHNTHKCANKNDARCFAFIYCFLGIFLKIIFSFSIFINTFYFMCWLIGMNLVAGFLSSITFMVFYVYFKMISGDYRYFYLIQKLNLKWATMIVLGYIVGFFYAVKNYDLLYNSYIIVLYEGCLVGGLAVLSFLVVKGLKYYNEKHGKRIALEAFRRNLRE